MKPTASTATISRYFHRGYLFSITPPVQDAGRFARPDWKNETGNSDSLERTFWQGRGNGALLELQLDIVGHFQDHEVIGNLDDLAGDAAVGDNFVTFLQVAQQVLLLFGTLGLRAPDHQVEDDQEANQEDPLEAGTGWAGGGCCCVRVGGGDKEAHWALLMEFSNNGCEQSVQRRNGKPALGVEGVDKGGQFTLLNSLA
ncbi:hypothetical protein EMIT047CA2_30364 [Pseudomonas soli]